MTIRDVRIVRALSVLVCVCFGGLSFDFVVGFAAEAEPRAVVAWPAGPLDVKIAFDRPIDAKSVESLVDQTIEYRADPATIDRSNPIAGGSNSKIDSSVDRRGKLRIAAARVDDDGMMLVLATDPHPREALYTAKLTGIRPAGVNSMPVGVDLAYDLSGVDAAWDDGTEDAKPAWNAWWPHCDPAVVKAHTTGSIEHKKTLEYLNRNGRLTLRTFLKLPPGKATIRIETNRPIETTLGSQTAEASGDRSTVELAIESTGDAVEWITVIKTSSQSNPLKFLTTLRTGDDPTPRTISPKMLILPWAPAPVVSFSSAAKPTFSLEGGDPGRGKLVFQSEQAKCSSCHKVRGEGGAIGPELDDFAGKDLESVYREIAEPSASIHPDFFAYTVARKDGRVAMGIVRARGADAIRVIDTNAQETLIPRSDVVELRPSSSSIMPAGLIGAIGEEKSRDLLAFLTQKPAAPAATAAQASNQTAARGKPNRPPRRRSLKEIQSITREPDSKIEPIDASKIRPIQILFVHGKKEFGPGEHEYPAWAEGWRRIVTKQPGVSATTVLDWPSVEQWRGADLAVFYFWDHDWAPNQLNDIDRFLAKGGGIVALHSSMVIDQDPKGLADRFGLASFSKKRKFLHAPHRVDFPSNLSDPIIHGFEHLDLIDEAYWEMAGDPARVTVLATAIEDGSPRPVVWKRETGGGRVFCTVFGHYAWTMDDPLFRALVFRGMAWAARLPERIWDPLVADGVELSD
jgi:putative heme-binding domain-containing protein